jgi:hypothetical protein
MKSPLPIVLLLFLTSCQPVPGGKSVTVAASAVQVAMPPRLALDISTPDRALKSYWMAKDSLRLAEFKFGKEEGKKYEELKVQLGYDPREVMTGETLAFVQGVASAPPTPMYEYSRDIVDIKQDTESRATAIARIKNSTPIPAGGVASESDQKRRENGEKFKYVLEKDSKGWTVAQVYKDDEYHAKYGGGKGDPWKKVFSAPDGTRDVPSLVLEYEN